MITYKALPEPDLLDLKSPLRFSSLHLSPLSAPSPLASLQSHAFSTGIFPLPSVQKLVLEDKKKTYSFYL